MIDKLTTLPRSSSASRSGRSPIPTCSETVLQRRSRLGLIATLVFVARDDTVTERPALLRSSGNRSRNGYCAPEVWRSTDSSVKRYQRCVRKFGDSDVAGVVAGEVLSQLPYPQAE